MEFEEDIPDPKGKDVLLHYMKVYRETEDSSTQSWHYPDDNDQRHAFAALLLRKGTFLLPSLIEWEAGWS
jgi:hypothetical protein